MSRGEVLLLSCYELGRQPLGLAWALAFLEREGLEATGVDLAVQPFPEQRVIDAAVVVLLVPMHTALRLGVSASRRIRSANPQAHVCFAGLYAWLNRELLLAGPADSVIAGESEEALVALVRALRSGDAVEGLAGVTTREHPAGPSLVRLEFPTPHRSTLPTLTHYAHFVDGARHVQAGAVESSRGCLHKCRHCPVVPVYGGRFFAVPQAVVLRDVRQQVTAGAGHITFADPDFLNGPTHAIRVARALHEEYPDVTFDFTAKIEHLLQHRSLLPEFAGLGCRFVVSAIESLSEDVLERLEKGHTAADVELALDLLDEAQIALHPTLLPFTPWSTLDEYIALLEWVRSRGMITHVPAVQLAVRLLIPAGARLLEHGTTEWLGEFDAQALGYRWTHPDPRMDDLHAAVSALVERADVSDEPPSDTFDAIRRSAYAGAGRTVPVDEHPSLWIRPEPPRLTEDWFC